MVSKIISDCLLTSKRVVIPNFGAFIHKEEGGAVVFVSFLKKDDGVLASLIRSSYGIAQIEAEEMIAEYVTQVKNGVESRGSFVIDCLGSMKIDSNGLYYLVYNPVASSLVQADFQSANANVVSPTTMKMTQSSVNKPVSELNQVESMTDAALRPTQARVAHPMQSPTAEDRLSSSAESALSGQNPVGSNPTTPRPAESSLRPQVVPQANQPVQQSQQRPQQPESQQQYQQSQQHPQQQPVQPVRPQQQPQSTQPVRTQQQSQYQQPQQPRPQSAQRPIRPEGRPISPKKDSDKFMIIAILAAIVAVAAIAYGLLSSDGGPDMEQIMRSVEQAKDTIAVGGK